MNIPVSAYTTKLNPMLLTGINIFSPRSVFGHASLEDKPTKTNHRVYYILCDKMFVKCARKQHINLECTSDAFPTVNNLKTAIKKKHEFNDGNINLSFYSHEGYPFLIFSDQCKYEISTNAYLQDSL